jgi:integral membrane sensor domain MASE1
VAAALAVTVPAALYLMAVWLVHGRYFKHGVAEQLVLPATAALVLVASLAGHWAVPLAGLAAAAGLATGIALTARRARNPMISHGQERTIGE